MATETKTFYPGEFLSDESYVGTRENTGNPIGKSSSNTSTYAQFRSAGSNYSYVYYKFDVSAIPADATIDSVTCKARGGLTSESNTSNREVYLTTGTTKKTASLAFATYGLYTLNTATWTRAELNDIRIRWYWYYSKTTAHYLRFYGADLTVTYTYQSEKFMLKLSGDYEDVARTFKKVSGIWVEQTELANVIEDGVRYQNGGEYVRPVVIIDFTVGSTALQAEEGMTWAEWCGSDYDTTTYNYAVASNGYVNLSDEVMWLTTSDGSHVKGSDTVIAGHAYKITPNDPS